MTIIYIKLPQTPSSTTSISPKTTPKPDGTDFTPRKSPITPKTDDKKDNKKDKDKKEDKTKATKDKPPQGNSIQHAIDLCDDSGGNGKDSADKTKAFKKQESDNNPTPKTTKQQRSRPTSPVNTDENSKSSKNTAKPDLLDTNKANTNTKSTISTPNNNKRKLEDHTPTPSKITITDDDEDDSKDEQFYQKIYETFNKAAQKRQAQPLPDDGIDLDDMMYVFLIIYYRTNW